MRWVALLLVLAAVHCGPQDDQPTETCAVVYDPQHPGQYHVSEECSDAGTP